MFTIKMALLFSVNIQTDYILIARPNCALAGKENILCRQESFYLQGILNNINEQETSFLDCKHKHMMKIGAPPDKVGVLHHLLPIEFHGSTNRIGI